MRRRGPRSQIAVIRRSVPKYRRTLPGMCPGESGHLIPDSIHSSLPSVALHNNNIDIETNSLHDSDASADNSPKGVVVYSVNIRCLKSHLSELCFHLEEQKPHVVCIQETWLDKSTKEIEVPGYQVISRRDRHEGENRGGVLTLSRNDFNGLVHIADSIIDERSMHFLKFDVETFLLGNWYRPGASEHNGYVELYGELAEYFTEIIGVLLIGDLNIHHERWLRFSNGHSAVGSDLKTLCDFHGMTQLVREPTRNEYLLDLALCDIGGASASVLPSIADHKIVRVELPVSEIREVSVPRAVWQLQAADWKTLEKKNSTT